MLIGQIRTLSIFVFVHLRNLDKLIGLLYVLCLKKKNKIPNDNILSKESNKENAQQ